MPCDTIFIEELFSENETAMSNSEIEKWKQGKIKGYYYSVSFQVSKEYKLSYEDLVAYGIESYD